MGECQSLKFSPSIVVAPEEPRAAEPSGYQVAVKMPVDQNPDDRANADLRTARLKLPAGTDISPSAGNDPASCSDSQFKAQAPTPQPLPTPESQSLAECPAASEIGLVSIETPLLAAPLEGRVFLGVPECAPCTAQDAQEGKVLRLLVQAAGSGVLVKLQGHISVSEATGQLTAVIDESPQLPVEELKLSFRGGPTALLANSAECDSPLSGSGQLTPYNSQTATEVSGAAFQLSGCGGPQFNPTFTAGTVANQAAQSSTAVVAIARGDQDQSLERFTVELPPGLLGLLSKVPACPPSVAQAAACATQSLIGTVRIAAGPGSDPLSLEGSVFLTGPHNGAPFGLSIVVPAHAGPLDLGAIDIQAGIQVDPATAALTLASDPLPQSLGGVPLQIRSLNLQINRPGFIVNPTNCRPMAVDAALASARGRSATPAQRFQAAGCSKLAFAPKLSAIADAKTTRLGGAYVHVKLLSTPGQANVRQVKLDLPKALPSRLTTLQQACLDTTFKANPARCPGGSIVGTAALTTPFLRALLTGPVYMVSHGGRSYPDLDAVVQGEGVTLTLTGTAGFAKGITSEAFRSLPDAPISTLDLMFLASSHSAFAANANLCKRKLPMPTEITGQNGAVVKQTTRIAVAGCPGTRSTLQRKEPR